MNISCCWLPFNTARERSTIIVPFLRWLCPFLCWPLFMTMYSAFLPATRAFAFAGSQHGSIKTNSMHLQLLVHRYSPTVAATTITAACRERLVTAPSSSCGCGTFYCVSSMAAPRRMDLTATKLTKNSESIDNFLFASHSFSSKTQRHAKPPTDHKNNHHRQWSQRRYYSSRSDDDDNNNDGNEWEVPTSIDIPIEKMDMSFNRASGSGGQNVNKVNTKVELKFHVMECDWLPLEVRQRLYQQERSRINKMGYLLLQCQEHRTQEKNRRTALSKLESMILQAYPRPKERKLRKGLSKVTKERRKEFKRQRSQIKRQRKDVTSKDW